MKKRLIYSIVIASLFTVGCSEDYLDPQRDTSLITSEDIAEFAPVNPELLSGTLEGIGSYMIKDQAVVSGAHYDFGQKGVDIWLDMLSGDVALSANTYGWYQNTANLVTTVDYTRPENRIIWQYYYKVISIANEVILSLGGENAVPETETLRVYLAQAKAYRAYGYFYLAQIFQRSYDPAQPILPYYETVVTNTAKVPASQIYALIIKDLTEAIPALENYTRQYKHNIDKNVAKGLLAYTYAAMGNYTDAKTISDDIIDTSGYNLTTKGQLAYPGIGSGFNDVNTESWMWGYDLTAEIGHQLIDWWGQMDYYTYSYAWAGDRKSIDSGLLAAIPSTDVRKTQFGTSGITNRMPINKFFAPARTAGGQQLITTDLIFMRIEEFYLLSAEAAANTGDEDTAKDRLKALLEIRLNGGAAAAAAYADPLTGQALKDAIYLQTRIEFWGEGKSYLALKRKQATVTRGTNHVFRAGQSFLYSIDEMSFQIPALEINNNPSITSQN
jgi:starch-binding outer membrane protein, SusD/RagB family